MKFLITLLTIAFLSISSFSQTINFTPADDVGNYPITTGTPQFNKTFTVVDLSFDWITEAVNGVDYFKKYMNFGSGTEHFFEVDASGAKYFKTIVPPGVDLFSVSSQVGHENILKAYSENGEIEDLTNNDYAVNSLWHTISIGWYASTNEINLDGSDSYDIVNKVRYNKHNVYNAGSMTTWFTSITTNFYVQDSAIYNRWVRAGMPMPEVCDDADAGSVEASKIIEEGYTLETINSISPATGGEGNITYQWQYNPYGLTFDKDTAWINDPTNTTENYTIPVGLTHGEYYARRLAFTDCGYTVSNIVTLTVEETTGINTISSNNFKIYPNPATKNLQLTINNEQLGGSIEILDITGKVVIERHCEQSEAISIIDISNLNNGVYFIKVGAQIQKFIKE